MWLSEIFCPHFCSIQCDHGKKSYEIFVVFRALPNPDGTKSWFCPRSNTHIALLLSQMGGLMKILSSCSEVIQRTLQSDKKWLRYSSFSVISRVELPILRAGPILELFKFLTPTLAKHDNVSKKIKTSKSETAGRFNKTKQHILVEDAPRKSILISSIQKVSIFLWNMLEKSPQCRHFTREIAVSKNEVLLFLTWFLVGPLPVLESP